MTPSPSRRAAALDLLNRPASAAALSALQTAPSAEALRALGIDPSTGKRVSETTSTELEAHRLLQQPASPETLEKLQFEDKKFQEIALSLLGSRGNNHDSLAPGEEFVSPTPEDMLKREVFTEMDILLRPVSEETLKKLKVGILSNRDGSDHVFLSGKKLDAFMMSGGIPGISKFSTSTLGEIQDSIAKRYLGQIAEVRPGELHPGLKKAMDKDPEIAFYANYAINAGNSAGLNGIMYANQLWQESRFNPDAVSGKGARGIAQMMPFHQGKYGLYTAEDFFDPLKSITAGAQMMFELTDKYKDQRLALAAYNGGQGAIQFVEKKLGKDQITYKDWHNFMQERRLKNPSSDSSAWQNETFDYLKKIGAGTPDDKPKPVQPPSPAFQPVGR